MGEHSGHFAQAGQPALALAGLRVGLAAGLAADQHERDAEQRSGGECTDAEREGRSVAQLVGLERLDLDHEAQLVAAGLELAQGAELHAEPAADLIDLAADRAAGRELVGAAGPEGGAGRRHHGDIIASLDHGEVAQAVVAALVDDGAELGRARQCL